MTMESDINTSKEIVLMSMAAIQWDSRFKFEKIFPRVLPLTEVGEAFDSINNSFKFQ